MDEWPREPAFKWEEKSCDGRRTVTELPVKMGTGLRLSMEIREYADGRTTVKVFKFPRSKGRIGDI